MHRLTRRIAGVALTLCLPLVGGCSDDQEPVKEPKPREDAAERAAGAGAAARCTQVFAAALAGPGAVVFVEAGTPTDRLQEIEDAVQATPGVDAVERAEPKVLVAAIEAVDEQAAAALVPADLPTAIHASSVVAISAEAITALSELDGVELVAAPEQTGPCDLGQSIAVDATDAVREAATDGVDLLVHLEPDASTAQRDDVQAEIEALDGVRAIRYVDQDAAYESFTCLFADDPAVLGQAQASDLPTSFRIDLGVRPSTDTMASASEALIGLSGVRETMAVPPAQEVLGTWGQEQVNALFDRDGCQADGEEVG